MKILIIDDNEAQAGLIRQIISKLKHIEPIVATDALEGYVILRAVVGIEAVILDYKMPYINGIEFLKKLRKTHPFEEIPVLISSAEDRTKEYIEAGATECLIKPYNITKLKEFTQHVFDLREEKSMVEKS